MNVSGLFCPTCQQARVFRSVEPNTAEAALLASDLRMLPILASGFMVAVCLFCQTVTMTAVFPPRTFPGLPVFELPKRGKKT